ncbi:unnamed protein product [Auanema sp. JU1783]|nr:unnamed protein product [Auanema sp. JU1783]
MAEDGHRIVSVSVIQDTGTRVQLMFKAQGLKKKKSLVNSIVTVFKKPHHPSKLLANGRFKKFELKDTSFHFILEIRNSSEPRSVEVFHCDINRFPTRVNPESAKFEVLEPASGECFILLSLIKIDNLSTNWKEFMSDNGTVDAAEQSQ